ncbi:MAG: hypothetical protein OHK0036_19000 [Bacteroidia bacterium]
MNDIAIYTIGYGNRKWADFLELLKQYQIKYLIDIRSIPYSRYNTQYNQSILKILLEKNNINYVYMGSELGGRPNDEKCYVNGLVDYEIVKNKAFYLKGIERLKTAYEKKLKIALMCSEINPCECHRSKLIGCTLHSFGINVLHIDENGQLKTQTQVLHTINKGNFEYNLFGETIHLTSRKKYT